MGGRKGRAETAPPTPIAWQGDESNTWLVQREGDQKRADTRGLCFTDQTARGSMRPLLPRPKSGLKEYLTSPPA